MRTTTGNTINYAAVEKIGEETFTKAGLQMCQDLMRETDNRNPEFFNLKIDNPEFGRYGELEVIENHLRVILKLYKLANKKKSPQSAWKPVYAALEALTIYIRSKDAWFDIKDKPRVEEVFKSFGNAWIATSERLSALGLFNENTFPSVRTVIAVTVAIGNQLNERFGQKISQWPEKLFEGDAKKKMEDDHMIKKKKKGSKKTGEEDAVEGVKKKGGRKAAKAEKEANLSPWDFVAAMTTLKGGRKQVGGCDYDIAQWGEEQRNKFVVMA
ncbi:hypothetical protein BC829DRAFT_385582 [Chytridium lagenaria]|nr:hypothetical protein BC829DRAFT_385582 [Chytridium lagenaria]